MKKASRKRKASARSGEEEAEPAKQRRGGGGSQSKKKSKQREVAAAGAVSEAPSSCPATESMDFASAVQLAVSQATQFPLGNDDSHLSIGSCCRVYWDDDDQWFTARVLLYDPGRRLHFIYYDEDGTTEWINAAESADAVQLGEQLILHNGYPARIFHLNAKSKAILGINLTPDHFYVEYFQHKASLPPQYCIVAARAINKPLRCNWPAAIKKSQSLAFEHAQKELDEIQRIRHFVMHACKTHLSTGQSAVGNNSFSTGRSSVLLGLRVRTSSCSVTAITSLFANPPAKEVDENESNLSEEGERSGSTTSVCDDNSSPRVQLAKCLGTIVDYCPGNDEYFVVFDNATVIAPKWIKVDGSHNNSFVMREKECDKQELHSSDTDDSLEQRHQLVEKDIAHRPNDVELIFDWKFPDESEEVIAESGRVNKTARRGKKSKKIRKSSNVAQTSEIDIEDREDDTNPVQPDDKNLETPLCGLCGLGDHDDSVVGNGNGAVVTCSVCQDHHYHRHCMPMRRVGLAENQTWRCWHCTCCECCGISAWYRESNLESIHDILIASPGEQLEHEVNNVWQLREQVLSQGEPLAPRGLCLPCVEMLRLGKGYCSVCYKKYIDDTPITLPPANHSRAVCNGRDSENCAPLMLSMGSAVAEEAQQMVCCDECNEWVHSKCEGIDESQYQSIANGTHPVWGNEYLCPLCRIKIPLTTINDLFEADKSGIFHFPITTDIAKTYFEVIHNPMDLSTMRNKASRGQYKSLQALRADFELMCLNALTFNKTDDEYWTIARLYYNKGVNLFSSYSRTTIGSAYGLEIRDVLKIAKYGPQTVVPITEHKQVPKPKKISLPKSAFKGDTNDYQRSYVTHRKRDERRALPVGGSNSYASYADMLVIDATQSKRRRLDNSGTCGGVATAITIDSAVSSTADHTNGNFDLDSPSNQPNNTAFTGLPNTLHKAPHPFSGAQHNPLSNRSPLSESIFFCTLQNMVHELLPHAEHVLSTDVAFYTCCRDACAICASPGSPEYFIYCQDCGECYHSFCVDAPLSIMLSQETTLTSSFCTARAELRRHVPARHRWKCPACSVTCSICHLSTCRAPACSQLLPHFSTEEGFRQASLFVSCHVCETVTHVGCIPYLSKEAWRKYAANASDDKFSESRTPKWICHECCICTECCHPNSKSDGKDVVTTKYLADRIGRVFFADANDRMWGFSTECCVRCTVRNVILGIPIKVSAVDDYPSYMSDIREWVPELLLLGTDKCGECSMDCENIWCEIKLAGQEKKRHVDRETVCCSICFVTFHVSCCTSATASFGVFFVCGVCCQRDVVMINGTSHVGRGNLSLQLLRCISDIQIMRREASLNLKSGSTVIDKNMSSSKILHGVTPSHTFAEKPVVAEIVKGHCKALLMTLITWAARRCSFLESDNSIRKYFEDHSLCSNFAIKRSSSVAISNVVRRRSMEFLRCWNLDGESPSVKDHKTRLIKGNYGVDEFATNPCIRPLDALKYIASLAVAFLHESSGELDEVTKQRPEAANIRNRDEWCAVPPPDMLLPFSKGASDETPHLALKALYLKLLSPDINIHSALNGWIRIFPKAAGSSTAKMSTGKSDEVKSACRQNVLHGNTLSRPLTSYSLSLEALLKHTDAHRKCSATDDDCQTSKQNAKSKKQLRVHDQRIGSTRTLSMASCLLNNFVLKNQRADVKKSKLKNAFTKSCGAGDMSQAKQISVRDTDSSAVIAKKDCIEEKDGQAFGIVDKVNLSPRDTTLLDPLMKIKPAQCPPSTSTISIAEKNEKSKNVSGNNKEMVAKKTKKKMVKKDSDNFRLRWEMYDRRHRLQASQRSLALASIYKLSSIKQDVEQSKVISSKSAVPNFQPMSTSLKHSKTGWIACNDVMMERKNTEITPIKHSDGVTVENELQAGGSNNNIFPSCIPSPRLKPAMNHIQPSLDIKSAHVEVRDVVDGSHLFWAPVEFCSFCHGTEEDEILGRLLPVTGSGKGTIAGGLWVHANCVRSAAGCHEWPSGAISGAEKAIERASETLCTLCGELGAAVRCEKAICKDHFHLKCALACDFIFTEAKRGRMTVVSKLAIRSLNVTEDGDLGDFTLQLPSTSATTYRKYFTLSACCEAHRLEGKRTTVLLSSNDRNRDLKNPLHRMQVVEDYYQEDAEEVGFITSPISNRTYNQMHTCKGMQHRPKASQGSAKQSKSKTIPEMYWESREKLVEEKLSLLKAGGHGLRYGSLTVHRLGSASFDLPGHHSADYIFPRGFKSTRIFWSMHTPMTRVLYTFEVQSCEYDEKNSHQRLLFPRPQFVVAVSDEAESLIVASSIEECYLQIVSKVKECNSQMWPNMLDYLRLGASGLKGTKACTVNSVIASNYNPDLLLARAAHFFGLGIDLVRYALETQSEALAAIVPELFFAEYPRGQNGELLFPAYRPRFYLPGKTQLAQILRRRAQQEHVSRKNLHGSARAEGWIPDKRAVNVALAAAGGEKKEHRIAGSASQLNGDKKVRARRGDNCAEEFFRDEWDDQLDEIEGTRRKARLLRKYQELSFRYQQDPFEKLEVKRSHIHGYGLYARAEIEKDEMIIEYIGEQVRQIVADVREVAYEEQGLGSCYMFRLDKEYIVDATHTGSMARFINHCCDANAYARVISVKPLEDAQLKAVAEGKVGESSEIPTNFPPASGFDSFEDALKPIEKRIIIFAGRTIQPGEEVTYDYKFPIEDEKLKCYCGAAKCRGSMN